MKYLSSVDPGFLMNIVGALTAIPEAEFPGYNGQCPEDVGDFFTSLLGVLVHQEKDELGVSSDQDKDAGIIEKMFGQGTIGQQVSTCHNKQILLQNSRETGQVSKVRTRLG